MKREEAPIRRYIPMNVADSGRCLNGLLQTRNLAEACILAFPIFLICFFGIPNEHMMQKIQIMSLVVGIPFIAGIIGVPPYSLFEAIGLLVRFKKNNHFAFFNPNLKMETAPDFLVHATNLPMFTQLKNSFDILFGNTNTEEKRKEAALTIANCTNEIHYKDSESETDWRKEQKKKEKAARKAQKERERQEAIRQKKEKKQYDAKHARKKGDEKK